MKNKYKSCISTLVMMSACLMANPAEANKPQVSQPPVMTKASLTTVRNKKSAVVETPEVRYRGIGRR
ncbi:MAG: hypothetical protein V7L04_14010 [Nostoc sp.]|uniref:hypothetical protein n=1 Tax=Nostoc sp. TaxID=1180 RepID=UPI002FF4D033